MALIVILSILNTQKSTANPSHQLMAPMPPQPALPFPMHFPMSMGIGIAVVQDEKDSTTTTPTTAKPFIDQHGVLNIPGGIDNIAIALSLPQLTMGLPPPMPFNMGMPMGFGIAVVQNEVTSTTTAKPCTDKYVQDNGNDIAIALPMPPMSVPIPVGQPVPSPGILAPQPVQFAVPGAIPTFCKKDKRHPSCPPCPPCSCQPCTPSFFSYCSSCHQKCRCKNGKDAPIPLPPIPPVPLPGPAFPMPFPVSFPMPSISSMPGSPQVVIIPYPPEMVSRRRCKQSDYSCEKHIIKDTDDSSDCSDNDSNCHYATHRKKNRPYINNGFYERRSGVMGRVDSGNIVIKPELNYLNDNGVVKIQKNLKKGEAIKLLAGDYNDDDTVDKEIRDRSNFRHKHSKMSVFRKW